VRIIFVAAERHQLNIDRSSAERGVGGRGAGSGLNRPLTASSLTS